MARQLVFLVVTRRDSWKIPIIFVGGSNPPRASNFLGDLMGYYPFHVFKSKAGSYIVARCAEEAHDTAEYFCLDDEYDEHDLLVCTLLPDDQPLSIRCQDRGIITRTCAEWAMNHGLGLLA